MMFMSLYFFLVVFVFLMYNDYVDFMPCEVSNVNSDWITPREAAESGELQTDTFKCCAPMEKPKA